MPDMERRSVVAAVGLLSLAGCTRIAGREEIVTGSVSTVGRECGERNHSCKGSIEDRDVVITGNFGTESVDRSVTYSVLTSNSSADPNIVYLNFEATDTATDYNDDCTGTIRYRGEFTVSEEIDILIVQHKLSDKIKKVNRFEF